MERFDMECYEGIFYKISKSLTSEKEMDAGWLRVDIRMKKNKKIMKKDRK
jgi:hypothetical protein